MERLRYFSDSRVREELMKMYHVRSVFPSHKPEALCV